ncbi:hypothetical protein HMI54_009271 [Coelomomyces lativittatus]|nr:hypothetical protein HMI54_009271 [Coelomomyces lativittatus]
MRFLCSNNSSFFVGSRPTIFNLYKIELHKVPISSRLFTHASTVPTPLPPSPPPLPPNTSEIITLHRIPMRPIYHGPLANKIKMLKIFSASTLGITYTVAPIVMWVDLPTAISMAGKSTLMLLAMLISGGSTALLNWALKSYVTRILVDTKATKLHPYTPFALETLNFLGRPKYFFTETNKVTLKKLPFSTWQTPSRKFYIHDHLVEKDPMGHQIMQLIHQNDTLGDRT